MNTFRTARVQDEGREHRFHRDKLLSNGTPVWMMTLVLDVHNHRDRCGCCGIYGPWLTMGPSRIPIWQS